MSPDAAPKTITAQHRRELKTAIAQLEQTSFAARLADYAGQPVNTVIKYLPRAINSRLRGIVQTAIFKCLEMALGSLDKTAITRPSPWTAKIVSGVTGGIGGFFGMLSLPLELPVTTMLLMRSIAEIAQDQGEDIGTVETQLACLEVFALGGRDSEEKWDVGYYATRTMLSKLTGDMAAYVLERGAVNVTTPTVSRLVGEIVSRFGFVVSERAAAGALPFIGAVGGAAVNMIFMDHFQRIARGHFTIRRLERIYGADPIQNDYRRQKKLMAGRYQRHPASLQMAER